MDDEPSFIETLGKKRENTVEKSGSTRFCVLNCYLHFYRAVLRPERTLTHQIGFSVS